MVPHSRAASLCLRASAAGSGEALATTWRMGSCSESVFPCARPFRRTTVVSPFCLQRSSHVAGAWDGFSGSTIHVFVKGLLIQATLMNVPFPLPRSMILPPSNCEGDSASDCTPHAAMCARCCRNVDFARHQQLNSCCDTK